jgi:ubiquinone/menaquinone biosynthesis C-methylase UbiE
MDERGTVTREYRPSLRDRLRQRLRHQLLARLRVVVAPEGARLLDLGGGTGAATVVFGSGARELVVLEPDGRRITEGRAAHAPVSFVQAGAEAIPFEAGRFDRVVSLVSFHHFPPGDAPLREAARVLSPGGRLVIYDYDPSSRSRRWWTFVMCRTHGHRHTFASPAEIQGRALAAGFHSAHQEPYGRGAFITAER